MTNLLTTAPIPFTEWPRPPFPLHACPGWLRAFINAVAVETQTPPDLAGMLALAVLSTACAKRVEVRLREGWIEPVNLFLVLALAAANRKSRVFKIMTKPVRSFEVSMTAQRTQTNTGATRLIVDDCSPERLVTLLCHNQGRIAALAPEGDLFEIIAGRYSGTPNFGVFLSAHAGDDVRVDRVNRMAEYVQSPALTLGLTVQPEVIKGLANKPGFRGRGLLGRFLFVLPESLVGRRAVNAPPVPDVLTQTYHENITALLNLPIATDQYGDPMPWIVDVNPAARALLEQYAAAIEPRLSEFGDLGLINDWAGKLCGAVIRIAGLLHLADHASQPRPWSNPIQESTMMSAIDLGNYFLAHAQAAFGEMGADPKVESARVVVRWLKHSGCATITKSELQQRMRGRFKRIHELDPILDLLVEHQFLTMIPYQDPGGPGRKPSPMFAVNVV